MIISLPASIRITVMIVLCFVASVLWLDQPVAYMIDAMEPSALKVLGHWLEEIGKSHWALSFCLIMAAVAWRSKKDIAHRHVVLFAAIAISGLIGIVLKLLVCRSRPPLLIDHGIFACDWFAFSREFLWQSFPSGHSTTGLSIAMAGSYAWPRLRWMMWPLGLAIAMARIAVNAHFLSDVIAGSLLGALTSSACIWYHQRYAERRAIR